MCVYIYIYIYYSGRQYIIQETAFTRTTFVLRQIMTAAILYVISIYSIYNDCTYCIVLYSKCCNALWYSILQYSIIYTHYIYIYIYICIHIYIYEIHAYICTYSYLSLSLYIYIYIERERYVYIHTCVCTYIYIYIYTDTHVITTAATEAKESANIILHYICIVIS